MKLIATALAFAYSPEREVLRSVSLSLCDSQVMFVLGSNGSGKTTLLQCLAGLMNPLRGSIILDGQTLRELPLRTRARRIGFVPQMHEPVFEFTVEQAVLMGRAPHLGLFERPGKKDRKAAIKAIDAVGIQHLSHRPYTKISGGERQLALIARGLAQGARILLMDEPVAHLDPHHQHAVLSVVRNLAADGFAFAIASHLPNHALLYADWAAFLVDGRADVQGPPATTITEGSLRVAYEMEFEIIRNDSGTQAILPRMR